MAQDNNCEGLEGRVVTLEKWMCEQQEREISNAREMGTFIQSISTMKGNIEKLNQSIDTLSAKITQLELQPGNRYNKIVDNFIAGIVALVVSLMFQGAK